MYIKERGLKKIKNQKIKYPSTGIKIGKHSDLSSLVFESRNNETELPKNGKTQLEEKTSGYRRKKHST